MGIPVLKGRTFSEFDREGTELVAIASASMAVRLWRDQDPIGKRVVIQGGQAVKIIGVANDVMHDWTEDRQHLALYRPLRQVAPNRINVAVRARSGVSTPTASIRRILNSVDPLVPLYHFQTMRQAIADNSLGITYLASLMAICGGIALALSAIGIYGVMSYAVAQRTHEFGIRMAFGATTRDVLYLTLQHAGTLTTAGIGIGLGIAWILGRLMASSLFGVISLDSVTFVAASLCLLVVSLAAAYIPARRTVGLDPAVVLRSE